MTDKSSNEEGVAERRSGARLETGSYAIDCREYRGVVKVYGWFPDEDSDQIIFQVKTPPGFNPYRVPESELYIYEEYEIGPCPECGSGVEAFGGSIQCKSESCCYSEHPDEYPDDLESR